MTGIYLDHAATTPLDKRVLEKMLPYFSEKFGNPNSLHFFGRAAVQAVDEARDTVAALLGAKASEIYFTSGGTESDNWALRGAAHANADRGKHLIISAIEHPAVLETAKALQREGFSVTYVGVDPFGRVRAEDVEAAIREDTILIGVMTANNEVGTIQPIEEISALARERNILFFTDAVQAAGALPLHVDAPHVDLLSVSGHKFYGPKGIGILYIRSGCKADKILTGGHQERGMRGGTTNVPSVVGIAEAFRLACDSLRENSLYVSALRDRFIRRILREVPQAKLNGHPTLRLPGNANICFGGIDGAALLFNLDREGIAASSGSACTAGTLQPSHVLAAMGLSEQDVRGSVRFSFGKDNTEKEADLAAEAVGEIALKLQKTGQ